MEVICDSRDLKLYMSPQDVTDQMWGTVRCVCVLKKWVWVVVWLFSTSSLLLHNFCLSQMMPSTSQGCATLCCYSGLKLCKFRPNFASSTAAKMIFSICLLPPRQRFESSHHTVNSLQNRTMTKMVTTAFSNEKYRKVFIWKDRMETFPIHKTHEV